MPRMTAPYGPMYGNALANPVPQQGIRRGLNALTYGPNLPSPGMPMRDAGLAAGAMMRPGPGLVPAAPVTPMRGGMGAGLGAIAPMGAAPQMGVPPGGPSGIMRGAGTYTDQPGGYIDIRKSPWETAMDLLLDSGFDAESAMFIVDKAKTGDQEMLDYIEQLYQNRIESQ